MTLEELENSLPNGLHDAAISDIAIDYKAKQAKLKLEVWVGDLDSEEDEIREAYRKGELILSGLVYFVIEPPDPTYKYNAEDAITVGAGSAKDKIKASVQLPQDLPSDVFAYWFFVHEWNSFIHVAAKDTKLEWLEDKFQQLTSR